MSTNGKLSQMLQKLLEASKEFRVKWIPYPTPESGSHDDYIVNFPNYSINIWDTEQRAIGLAMLDETGEILSSWTFSIDSPHGKILYEILNLAKAKAGRVDTILEDLTKILGQEGPIGLPKPPPPQPPDMGEDEIPF